MPTPSIQVNITNNLDKILDLLNDIYESLENNGYFEEATVVREHIKKLNTPAIYSRIHSDGINPVMEELAESFEN